MRRFTLSLCILLMMFGTLGVAACLSGCGDIGGEIETQDVDPAFADGIRQVGARSEMEEERRLEKEALEQGKPVE